MRGGAGSRNVDGVEKGYSVTPDWWSWRRPGYLKLSLLNFIRQGIVFYKPIKIFPNRDISL
ncbi:MAG: hypothetical protein LBT13_07580, partial [Treponema sp.]|nr:hypothetical protein [Treponema sp.]